VQETTSKLYWAVRSGSYDGPCDLRHGLIRDHGCQTNCPRITDGPSCQRGFVAIFNMRKLNPFGGTLSGLSSNTSSDWHYNCQRDPNAQSASLRDGSSCSL
jgi:hypothetical protein